MPAPLLSASNSISKPSTRRHSGSENFFTDSRYLHFQQQEKQSLTLLPLPLSPSQKSNSTIYSCIGFIFFFFIITIVCCLHCCNFDPPGMVEHTSLTTKPVVRGQKLVNTTKATAALKGLGTVFIRGSKIMSELVVAHITEDTQLEDLKLFLRTLYRSGVIARADLVFLFTGTALPLSMVNVMHEENCNFHKLLYVYTCESSDGVHSIENASSSSTLSTMHSSLTASVSSFNLDAYKKASAEFELSSQRSFWGSRTGNISHDNRSANATQQFGWGSIVGFDAAELNPDDTLQGFFDHPPVMLRRWACYQMLLGMVRHRFKHVLLTDVSGVAILGDPFTMARRRVGLYLTLEDRAWGASNAVELGVSLRSLNAESDNGLSGQDGGRSRVTSASSKIAVKKQPDVQPDVRQRGTGGRRRARKGAPVGGLYERVYGKQMWSSLEEFERTKKLVNSGVIIGGIHQIRGLANSMVTEIVKVALERTNRDSFPDSVLLSYLLHKSSSVLGKRVLDHLHLLVNAESFVHSLRGSQQSSFFFKKSKAAYPMIQGNSKSKRWLTATQSIHYDICMSPADAMVYGDCMHTQTSERICQPAPQVYGNCTTPSLISFI